MVGLLNKSLSRGESSMTPTIELATAIVYITSAIAIAVMRKLDRSKKWYPPYVITICVIYTMFIYWYTK